MQVQPLKFIHFAAPLFLIMALLCVVFVPAVSSQQDETALRVVRAAFQTLRSERNYAFTTESFGKVITIDGGAELASEDEIFIEGAVAQNGDYSVARTQTTIREGTPFTHYTAWWSVGDERYYFFDENYAQAFDIEQGLWSESDLIAAHGNDLWFAYIYFDATLPQHTLPHLFIPDLAVITNARELPNEVINDRAFRVFVVEVNALTLWYLQTSENSIDAFVDFMNNLPREGFTYEVSLRVWIDMVDDRLRYMQWSEYNAIVFPDAWSNENTYISHYAITYPEDAIIIEALHQAR